MVQPGPPSPTPPEPPPQYPPGHFPPPVQQKRRVWPWVLGILALFMVLMFAGCVALLGTAANEVSNSSSPAAEPVAGQPPAGQPPAAAGLNTPVRDGKFEFTVTKVDPGHAAVGTDSLGEQAQGQFVFVHVSVRNIGDVAQVFSGSSQKLFDAQGREFSDDAAAAIYLDQSQSFLNEINPGNAVNGIVVFDIPKDAQPTRIELHDSPFSAGVSVALS